MNRIGGKSQHRRGRRGRRPLHADANGDHRRSAIKQVASGRFGVTSEYLVNADDIQIKMAQGAKPGEGGQLPGHKVYPWIARTRHSTPGVGLISPPPHHDIYSIEDLAQLIHDLKNANPTARIHVKLVAEVGVGTVAAGVAKAHSDVVLISGHDGGTGAAPLTSLKHAGAPWELGLAETQQTLLLNGLRDRIVVQVDGSMKTGRDVVIGALLGAEEFGFATAPLVVSGCVMMRVCHLDTCPVGVATQNPELRKRFTGKPEFVVTFFEYIAEEVREYLAALGFRSIEEAVGHAELLDIGAGDRRTGRPPGLDLDAAAARAGAARSAATCARDRDAGPRAGQGAGQHADPAVRGRAADGRPVWLEMPIRNVNRTVGTMLGSEVTRAVRWRRACPTTPSRCTSPARRASRFGAFVPRGITLRLEGDANDYVGKGLSGGQIIVLPAGGARRSSPRTTSSPATCRSTAPPAARCSARHGRRAVLRPQLRCDRRRRGRRRPRLRVHDRRSGASILGPTGRNFAAGMSGGIAYLLDAGRGRINPEMVDLEALDADDEHLRARPAGAACHGDRLARRAGAAARLGSPLQRFTKVMPRDYKRVLEAIRRAEEAGRGRRRNGDDHGGGSRG